MLKETSRHFSCSVLQSCCHILLSCFAVPFGSGIIDFLFIQNQTQVDMFSYFYKKKERKYLHPANRDCSHIHVRMLYNLSI